MERIKEHISQNLKLFGASKSKIIDNQVSNKNMPAFLYMMRAANSAKNFLASKNAKTVVIFIGKGNNGEDGLCLAALLKIQRVNVFLIDLVYENRRASVSKELCESLGVFGEKFDIKTIRKADWYVDAILGTGVSRELDGVFLAATKFLSSTKKKNVLSLDIPTGLDASKGLIFKNSVHASATISFLTLKPGLFFDKAAQRSGEVYFDNLGVIKYEENADMVMIGKKNCSFPQLLKDAHKGSRGSVICLGGSSGMEGAGIMSGISALRAGAGKVFWATDNKSLDRPHELIQIEPSIKDLKRVINKNTRLAIVGPGLGMGYEREIEFLWKSNLQLIIDADGLRWLAQTQPKRRSAPWIGTPHEGETVDLLGDIFSDKWSNIINLKKIYGGDWILKGPGTLVSENGKLWLSDYSNGWLGTAGMGDVLAGILAGLWASGSKYPARSSVFLQTQSAKRFLKNNNDAGLTATDISNLVGISLGDLQKASGKAQES